MKKTPVILHGWKVSEISDPAWLQVLLGIHDAEVPEAERVKLARKVLRSEYRLGWYMVFSQYRMLQMGGHGDLPNWLEVLSGPIRLKAVKVLKSAPGYGGRSWTCAMMALSLCCKAKDAPVILEHLRRVMMEGARAPEAQDGFDALFRIIRWEPQRQFPEIFGFSREILSQPVADGIYQVAHLLSCSNHPEAENILLEAADRLRDDPEQIWLEWALMSVNPQQYLPRGREVLERYKSLLTARDPQSRLDGYNRLRSGVWRLEQALQEAENA